MDNSKNNQLSNLGKPKATPPSSALTSQPTPEPQQESNPKPFVDIEKSLIDETTHQSDEISLGKPIAIPPNYASLQKVDQTNSTEQEKNQNTGSVTQGFSVVNGKMGIRPGGETLGVPKATHAPVARPLTPEEEKAHKEKVKQDEEAERRKKIEELLEELRAAKTWFHVPDWIQNLIMYATVLLAAILMLFIIAQITAFISMVATLPVISCWIIAICGSFCCAIIIILLVRIGWMIRRMKKSPNLDLRAIELLNKRTEWQLCAALNEKQKDAKKELLKYLNGFDDKKRHRLFVKSLGMKQVTFDSLTKEKNNLCEFEGTTKEWIDGFQKRFQSQLDDFAAERIKKYYYKVMTGTALSPNPMVDQIIVITACTAMVHELLQIYELRPAAGQSLVLLARGIVLAYIGGQLQQVMETVVDKAGDAAVDAATAMGITDISDELTKAFGANAANALPIVGQITAPIAAKIAEGILNGLLVQRLGKQIVRQLQPTVR